MPARIPNTPKPKGTPKAKRKRAAKERANGQAITETNPLGAGRTEAGIDLEKADRMLMAGCTGTTIAKTIGIHPDTLYQRIKDVYGVTDFSAYAQQMRAVGDDNLKLAQYTNAMKGNPIMQIWLGKNRLGQADKVESKNEDRVVIDFRRPTPAQEATPPTVADDGG